MKANMLFGVKFAYQDEGLQLVLGHYYAWKLEKMNPYREILEGLTMLVGQSMGFSKEDIANEFEKTSGYKLPDFKEVYDLVNAQNCKNYYITDNVLNMAGTIRVKEPFDLEWLKSMKDGVRQLNFKNSLIRYSKQGSRIVAVSVSQFPHGVETKELKYTFFNFDLEKNMASKQEIPDDYDIKGQGNSLLDYDTASRKTFYQLITYMELAPIQEVFLPAGRKHGTKKSPDNLLNTEKFPITIVNTNWNKSIRTDGFEVRGHSRKQACGPNFSQRKLIWIEDFQKKGYQRSAGRSQDKNRKGPSI